MSNLVSLRGEAIPAPGEVNPEVVELAEKLLDLARSGEIKALQAFMVHADDCVSAQSKGGANYRLVGIMTHVIHDICAAME
jgi:hypothetical protein